MIKRPKIIVFDLDCTMWPFHVDTHFTPPFRKKGDEVVDAYGQGVRHFKDVPQILKRLSDEGYELGVASRTSEIQGAQQLLDLFDWRKYFKYIEIYPGRKTTHFSKIKGLSDADYKDMMFFDDEYRNIRDCNEIGVTSIYVRDGVSLSLVEKSLENFKKQS